MELEWKSEHVKQEGEMGWVGIAAFPQDADTVKAENRSMG